jgi:hypothetical protein
MYIQVQRVLSAKKIGKNERTKIKDGKGKTTENV